MKKYNAKNPLIFCADQIDVITNFAVITNVVIKRVYCKAVMVLPLGTCLRQV